jgi:60 kDa SS-A/Ro ribonucleoprotein
VATKYAKHFSSLQTPQSEPIPGKAMVPNSGGGFTFAIDDWARLERFLVLGCDGGTYYASERTLTVQNAQCVQRCLDADPARTVATIVAVSDAGRAPKNDPAVFALAMAAGMGHTALAMEALPKVCRIGTHLFQFVEAVEAFRGWGRGLRKGLAAWYAGKNADDLAYQLAKYQSRDGWSHRDILRLAHPVASTPAHDAAFRWVVGGVDALAARAVSRRIKDGEAQATYPDVSEHLPALIRAFEAAKTASRPELVRLIRDRNLPRECVPTEALNDANVWDALLSKMPLTALVRNLGKMTAVGLLKPHASAVKTVLDKLSDGDYLRKSRLHPVAILIAAKQYAAGHGLKGSLTWQPVGAINDALDAAFYAAFGAVEPAGKRTLLALDVSGSMGMGGIAGSSLTPREGSAAMAMVAARTEPFVHAVGFTAAAGGYGGQFGGGESGMTPIDLSRQKALRDVVSAMEKLPMGGTDCALPMIYALRQKIEVDTFIIYTDNETWAGAIHPCQALTQYRREMNIPAKLIVVGMTATGFSIADPSDAGMLDVVGFDAAAPGVMNDFSRGNAVLS